MNFVKTGSLTQQITKDGIQIDEKDVRSEEVKAHEALKQTLPEFNQSRATFVPEHFKDGKVSDNDVPFGHVNTDPEGETDYGISDRLTADDLEFQQKLQRENTLKEEQRRRDIADEVNAFRVAKMKHGIEEVPLDTAAPSKPNAASNELDTQVSSSANCNIGGSKKSLFGKKGLLTSHKDKTSTGGSISEQDKIKENGSVALKKPESNLSGLKRARSVTSDAVVQPNKVAKVENAVASGNDNGGLFLSTYASSSSDEE